MKRLLTFLSLLFLLITVSPARADEPPVRIMPLGDSLTLGYTVPTYLSGYRDLLYALLVNAGYNVDYVGTLLDTQNPALPDPDHEGHGGFRIDQIDTNIEGWLTGLNDPDVILLLIGANDFNQNYNTGTAASRLESLIAQIASLRPFAKIIVANLPLRTDSASLEAAQGVYNAAIPGIVNNQVALGRQVFFLNMHAALVPSDLSSDGLHPNQSGYDKMAQAWVPAITNVITPLGTANPPAIVRARSIDAQHVTITFSKPIEDAAAGLSHFSLNGGVPILQVTLDAASKRIITLTTGPLTEHQTYTVSVTGIRDRTPQQNQIAPGATVMFTAEGVANGSFESADYAGWTAGGNQAIAVNNSYPTTDGANVLVYNWGQNAPNGVVAQTVTTIPGQQYVLRFDVGVIGYNTNEQRLKVTAQGTSLLVSDTVSIFAPGGGVVLWRAKSYTFVADSTATTLTFRDVSPTSINLDMLLDNVRVSTAATLAVTSSPTSGVNVTVSPLDNSGAGSGATSLSRLYITGTVVTVTAPASAGGKTFQKWQKDGVDLGTSLSATVTMDGNHTLNAIYVGAFSNGSFESADYSGWTASGNQNIAVGNTYPTTDGSNVLVFNWGQSAPNGVISQSLATVPGQSYVLQFDVGVIGYSTSEQRLQVTAQGSAALVNDTVSLFAPGGGVVLWVPKSYTFVADSTVTVLTFRDVSPTSLNLDMLLDHIRVSTAGARTLTVASSPNSGVSVTVSPTDNNGAGNGVSGFSRAYEVGAVVSLTAPAVAVGKNFVKWQKDGADLPAGLSATVTMDANHTLTAIYATAGAFINGSFESADYTGWNNTGNQAIAVGNTYPTTHGSNVLVFNWGQSAPNGAVVQSFATTVGQSYTLQFDLGVVSYAPAEQRLEVTAQGAAVLVGDTVSIFGLGGGAVSWLAKSYTFVADSAATALTFRDVSPTSLNLDMLLDNVRVASGRTLTVTTSPNSGVNVTVSPSDTTGAGNGLSSLSRVYNQNTVVNLTVPATAGGKTFLKWQRDGVDFSTNPATSVTIDADHTLNAVYVGAFVNGGFESADYTGWTASGNQNIAVGNTYPTTEGSNVLVYNWAQRTPNGVVSQSFATTAGQTYTLQFDVGTIGYSSNEQRLQVTAQGATALVADTVSLFDVGGGAVSWVAKSYTFVANSATTTLTFRDVSPTSENVDMLLDRVRVGTGGTLTVNSAPNSGVSVTVSPLDNNNAGNGVSGFSRVYNVGTVVNLTAPATAGGKTFLKWQKDGVNFSTNPSTSITIDGDHTLSAVYVGAFSNGSFEFADYAGWTQSGNQNIAVGNTYPTTQGSNVLVYNWAQLAPNGLVAQSFATTVGQTYTLQFDVGVLGYSTSEQRLEVIAQGNTSLVADTVSVFGLGGGAVTWVAKSYSFVANRATTTLSFRDVSPTSENLDMLLDNVRVLP